MKKYQKQKCLKTIAKQKEAFQKIKDMNEKGLHYYKEVEEMDKKQ